MGLWMNHSLTYSQSFPLYTKLSFQLHQYHLSKTKTTTPPPNNLLPSINNSIKNSSNVNYFQQSAENYFCKYCVLFLLQLRIWTRLILTVFPACAAWVLQKINTTIGLSIIFYRNSSFLLRDTLVQTWLLYKRGQLTVLLKLIWKDKERCICISSD